MGPFLTILVLMAFAAFAIAAWVAANRRQAALAEFAAAWGFTWHGGKDPFGIESRYGAFAALARGHSRGAANVFNGARHGRPVVCFDYRYKTGSGKNESTHSFSAALISMGWVFPHLLVRPENFLDKVAEFVGMDDIDFESAEFSRKFFVKSDNRKFAFDLFHARAMEYLLAQPAPYTLEFSGEAMLITNDRSWDPAGFAAAVAHVEGLLDLMPEYLRRELQDALR
ncbi:MAG: hypothetical protein WC708_19905 [Lentisphaeria bacterium]